MNNTNFTTNDKRNKNNSFILKYAMESEDIFEEEPTKQFNDDYALLHRIHQTMMEMLTDRGFQVSREEVETFDPIVFEEYYKKRIKEKKLNIHKVLKKTFTSLILSLSEVYYSPSKGYTYVRYIEHIPKEEGSKKEREIGSDVIDEILSEISTLLELYPGNISSVIVVTPQKISNHGMTSFTNLKSAPVTVFHYKELLLNITKHCLVPQHQLMTLDQKKAFFESINKINPASVPAILPKIFSSDPVCKYYGAVPGDVFKIIRNGLYGDLLVKDTIFYRIVVIPSQVMKEKTNASPYTTKE
jgi:DNA-directed RNA polymerase I, II, and III subunit RPABC1